MKDLTDGQIVLRKLTITDAVDFYNLYAQPELLATYSESPFLPHETPEAFTTRIIAACEFIWTIRLAHNPEKIIGDCALHHFAPTEKEIEIGGSLLPEFRGKMYMQAAFKLAEKIARNEIGAKALLTKTQSHNASAIRMAEKAGFTVIVRDETETVLRKSV